MIDGAFRQSREIGMSIGRVGGNFYVNILYLNFMDNYFPEIYQNLRKVIDENYLIEDIEDYSVFNASFIMDEFKHICFEKDNLMLGIYRVGSYQLGFYSSPYVHKTKIDGEYEPTLVEIPQKKSIMQKLHLAKSPKPEYRLSNKYKVNLSIDKILSTDLIEGIPSPIQHTIVDYWKGDGIWELFLLDNLRYLLPAFGHGIYTRRHFITSTEDLLDLPELVRNKAFRLQPNLLPLAIYKGGDTVEISICYFNKWEGLVRWTTRYMHCSDSGTNVMANKIISPEDNYEVLIPYDCGIRY